MNKQDVVKKILAEKFAMPPTQAKATAFAPANIALCKYWGKRDSELNLPLTSSLSISLGNKGSEVTLGVLDGDRDDVTVNAKPIDHSTMFYQRLREFLNLFTQQNFIIEIKSNIPIAAGLASSASGFASVTLALNKLFAWQLSPTQLSILARLGSGSACRSLWQGFVKWEQGANNDGFDSFATPLQTTWPEIMVGLLILDDQAKFISSREAMQRTVTTSKLYKMWPEKVSRDLALLNQAILQKDFKLLGQTAESNAIAMHTTMQNAFPPIQYSTQTTMDAFHQVWELRAKGINVFATQDAGPNLKLLFLDKDLPTIAHEFKFGEFVRPFATQAQTID